MDKALEKLSASALRKVLIEEINEFIICLDNGSTEELEQRKSRLRKVYELLATKEMEESARLVWGRNTAQTGETKIMEPSKEDYRE